MPRLSADIWIDQINGDGRNAAYRTEPLTQRTTVFGPPANLGLTKHPAGNNLLKTPFRENAWGVLKKSVTEIVNFGDQAGLVCLRNQQTANQ